MLLVNYTNVTWHQPSFLRRSVVLLSTVNGMLRQNPLPPRLISDDCLDERTIMCACASTLHVLFKNVKNKVQIPRSVERSSTDVVGIDRDQPMLPLTLGII